MRNAPLASIKAMIVAGFLAFGMLSAAPSSQAADAELVPEPWVHETHEYNVSGDIDGVPTDEFFVNERWSIEVEHGDVMTLIMARNITQSGIASVDYTNNIHYTINGKLYIAQFMMTGLVFKFGGYGINSPLSTCSDFEVSYTPIVYDGTVPTFDCNMTYRGIHVYSGPFPAEFGASQVDLTLAHHIRADWNSTAIKVEALIDFGDAVFFNPDDGDNEYPAGTSFAAEVSYMMMLANPEDLRTIGPVIPTSYTNTTLNYNMTLDDGTPLTMSKLDMREDFTIYNSTGATPATGYSSMNVFGGQAHVTHGFPGLAYGDTQSMVSDPEITVYHDTVTEDDYNFGNQTPPWGLIALIAAIAAVGGVAAVFLLRKRKSEGKP